METRSLLLAGLKPDAESRLLAALKDIPLERVSPEGALNLEAARRLAPDVALVSVERELEKSFDVIAALAQAGSRVIVLSPFEEAELILRAMRAGAREFLVAGDEKELEKALRAQLRPAQAGLGSMTAVFPAKGGMGATSIATNLAGALQRRGERVCLLDLDLELGDVLSFLDLEISFSIADVVANMKRFDRDLLDSSIPRHRSGVFVLAQGEKIEAADAVDATMVTTLLGFLRHHYSHVIVDGVRRFEDLALAALDAADRILLITTQEVPAVRSAQRCVEIFRRLGYPDAKAQLIVNRFQKRSSISREVIAQTTGLSVAATVSNDFASLARAVNRGVLLFDEAPAALITKDIDALAPVLGIQEGSASRQKSILSRFFRPRTVAHGA